MSDEIKSTSQATGTTENQQVPQQVPSNKGKGKASEDMDMDDDSSSEEEQEVICVIICWLLLQKLRRSRRTPLVRRHRYPCAIDGH